MPAHAFVERPSSARSEPVHGRRNIKSWILHGLVRRPFGGSEIEVPADRAASESQRGRITVGVRPEKVTLHDSAPKEATGRNVVGPGRITDVSFSGVSTQYEVTLPTHGVVTVFSQNTSIKAMHHDGDEVWLSWSLEHAFGLADESYTAAGSRFQADTDTSMIATQSREQLKAELGKD